VLVIKKGFAFILVNFIYLKKWDSIMAKKYTITLYPDKCIGCGACAGVEAELFEMDEETYISKLKSSVKKEEDGKEVWVFETDDPKNAKEAAEICPGQAIKVEESEE
jgi:ferredoxin